MSAAERWRAASGISRMLVDELRAGRLPTSADPITTEAIWQAIGAAADYLEAGLAEPAPATIADYEREARARSPEGRKAAQLALFAAAEADPAGEAQRAAASGAAVGAIVGAAADAPAPPNLRPWKPAAAAKVPAPVCAPCGGVPLVPAADMPREGEATGGKPLGCPACGEGYDGTPEQIALAQADSEAATKRIAAAEGKCWRCWGPRHRGRCKGAR